MENGNCEAASDARDEREREWRAELFERTLFIAQPSVSAAVKCTCF